MHRKKMNKSFEHHYLKDYKSFICFIIFAIFSINFGLAQKLNPAQNILIYKSDRYNKHIMIQSVENQNDTLFIVLATLVSLKDSFYNESITNELLNYFKKTAQLGNKNEIDTNIEFKNERKYFQDTVYYYNNKRFKIHNLITSKRNDFEIVDFDLKCTNYVGDKIADIDQLSLCLVNKDKNIGFFSNDLDFLGFNLYVFQKDFWFLKFQYWIPGVGEDFFELNYFNGNSIDVKSRLNSLSCE